MLYVDLMDDALWISMELMDRSLADVLNLVEEGVQMDERHIARFAKDVSILLQFSSCIVELMRLVDVDCIELPSTTGNRPSGCPF